MTKIFTLIGWICALVAATMILVGLIDPLIIFLACFTVFLMLLWRWV